MSFNLLRKYNELLEIGHLSAKQRNESLYQIFERDFIENAPILFAENGKKINPIYTDEPSLEVLFNHLTTVITDKKTSKREFELQRSLRLHWVAYHLLKKDDTKIIVFSTKESAGIRTYIFDDNESYVIVLEPYRNAKEYYLLTAYYLEGRNKKKILSKYKRRLPEIY